MTDSVFDVVQAGLLKEVSGPQYGKQHQGIAPGGAMDLFSFRMGNLLLNRDADAPSLEIIIAPVIRFNCDCWFVLTGAKYERAMIKQDQADAAVTPTEIPFATVCLAKKGETLSFGNKGSGFRTYLAYLPRDKSPANLTGKTRPPYQVIYDWVDQQGMIRVLEGPEYEYLVDKSAFTDTYWTITNDFNDMGFRLATRDRVPAVTLKNMISEAVADGTVQLAPKGPIVLLKQRQTVGGYPRIYNVISADVDLLGQYAPNQILRFKKITVDQALTIANRKATALSKISG